MIDQLPPQNLEAEQCTLGSMLLDNATIDDISAFLKADDFYRDAHQAVYEAILALRAGGRPVDPMLLEEWLQRAGRLSGAGGTRGILDILRAPPSAANATYYAQIVQAKAVARRLIEQANATQRECYSNTYTAEELVEMAEARLFAIGEERSSGETSESSLAIDEANAALDRRAAGEITGVPSGLAEIDDVTGGFQPGTLTIIGARPSAGKTALCLNIADHAACNAGVVPLVVSLEMSGAELALRMLSSRAEVDGYRLRNAYLLTDGERAKIAQASAALRQHSFPLDQSASRTVAQIASNARRLKARRGIGLVIVDYLQLVEGEGHSRQEQVASISRRLKQLAKELGIPVIALSQINRQAEGREDHRPRMSDLRESGAIEQDADVVILLHRPDYYDENDQPGLAEAIIAKNRNGAVCTAKLVFRKSIARFDSLYPGNP